VVEIILNLELPESHTYILSCESIAIPHGWQNLAVVPFPSLKPGFILPATVVTSSF